MGACAGKETKGKKPAKEVELDSKAPAAKKTEAASEKSKPKKTQETTETEAPAAEKKPKKAKQPEPEVEPEPETSKKPKKPKAEKEDKENAAPKNTTESPAEPEATKPEKKKKKSDDDKEGETTKPSGDSEPRKTLEEATAETEALYKKYRAEADEHAQLRSKYMEESKAAFEAGDKAKAKELSEKGKEEGRLMEEAGLRAARAIFAGKNESQPEGTIDLHGLHVKEAELIVREELAKAKKQGLSELKIIIGAGHHSGKEGPKVGPAIKKMLDEDSVKWAMDETNASGGALIATL